MMPISGIKGPGSQIIIYNIMVVKIMTSQEEHKIISRNNPSPWVQSESLTQVHEKGIKNLNLTHDLFLMILSNCVKINHSG